MFGARDSAKAKWERAAQRCAGASLALSLLGGAAQACGTGSVQSAIQAPQTSSKFALASQFCTVKPGLSSAAAAEVARQPVADVSAHSQQLFLYDKPTQGVVGATPPITSTAAVDALDAPRRPVLDRTPMPRALAGMSRDSTSRALALVPQISQVAEAYRIDPLLLHAIAHVESRHNPSAVSHAGAVGLMQVMPATARRFGVTQPQSELRDPRISLEVSSAYLKILQKRFDNDLSLVIAAYNAGEGAVEKYGRRVPPYKETQGYVRDVMAHYRLLLGARDATRPVSRSAL